MDASAAADTREAAAVWPTFRLLHSKQDMPSTRGGGAKNMSINSSDWDAYDVH